MHDTLQLFFLKKAIHEIGSTKHSDNHQLRIDHKNGCNYIDTIKIPITFPIYLLKYIDTIDKTKMYDYNFVGTITEKRKWIRKYTDNSIITNSNYGRNPDTKYEIDKNYYDIISKSKFTLTPTGDCPWSYRFFEAIMCLSIPILENKSDDIYKNEYFYYVDNDKHVYSKDIAIQNYNIFVNSKHFLKNIRELDKIFLT
jgi:hypothetical protein